MHDKLYKLGHALYIHKYRSIYYNLSFPRCLGWNLLHNNNNNSMSDASEKLPENMSYCDVIVTDVYEVCDFVRNGWTNYFAICKMIALCMHHLLQALIFSFAKCNLIYRYGHALNWIVSNEFKLSEVLGSWTSTKHVNIGWSDSRHDRYRNADGYRYLRFFYSLR